MTLCFLIRELADGKKQICLAEKKRGFRTGRWNGSGGKLEGNESIEQCIRRETFEELRVRIIDLKFVGCVVHNNPDIVYVVHTFICTKWNGEPEETEELRPYWVDLDSIPYEKMGVTSIRWLPHVLEGRMLNAFFYYVDGQVTGEQITFLN